MPHNGSGTPLMIPLQQILEDPHQPRTNSNPGFSSSSLKELASTITERGIKTPISVRELKDRPGLYMINHGARRYRASKLANLEHIPAFIDNHYNEADQVIENLHRNELTPREIADFIGRESARGQSVAAISKKLGKSTSFIYQHMALLDLPTSLAQAFNSGRINDTTTVYELTKAYEQDPVTVESWLDEQDSVITRANVKTLREFIKTQPHKISESVIDEPQEEYQFQAQEDSPTDFVGGVHQKTSRRHVIVQYQDQEAVLKVHRRSPAHGKAWLQLKSGGDDFEAEMGDLKLLYLEEIQ